MKYNHILDLKRCFVLLSKKINIFDVIYVYIEYIPMNTIMFIPFFALMIGKLFCLFLFSYSRFFFHFSLKRRREKKIVQQYSFVCNYAWRFTCTRSAGLGIGIRPSFIYSWFINCSFFCNQISNPECSFNQKIIL